MEAARCEKDIWNLQKGSREYGEPKIIIYFGMCLCW
jgi:hypothetical protein